MMACPAMAMASSAKASSTQMELTTWYAASMIVPPAAATTVVSVIATCRVAVRAISQTPVRAAANTPLGWKPSRTSARRAPRTTMTAITTAAPVWAIRVPMADPRMPRPTPYTRVAFKTMLTRLVATATLSGVVVSCSPRRTPVPASSTSTAGSPQTATRR